jgi:hypothetical protein
MVRKTRRYEMIDVQKQHDPRAEKLLEWAGARDERQEAMIEYVAMMADVDLPEDEEVDGDV